MARIPYADLSNPEAKPIVDRIVAERGSVLHLYQMLLNSPPMFISPPETLRTTIDRNSRS